jgi:hypothetical protein
MRTTKKQLLYRADSGGEVKGVSLLSARRSCNVEQLAIRQRIEAKRRGTGDYPQVPFS